MQMQKSAGRISMTAENLLSGMRSVFFLDGVFVKSIAVVAALILAYAGSALAQTAQAPLPDVNVTAPATTESFITRGFTPYDGNVKVEEDKWPTIPCATARISAGPDGKCQTGTPTENFLSRANGEPGNCVIYHQLVTFQTGVSSVEADSFIFDPYKVVSGSPTGHQDKNCFIWSGYLRPLADFPDMNQVTRRGTGWRNLVVGKPLSTFDFFDNGRTCTAIEKLGPNWHGGYIWVVHASICQPDVRPVQPSDITTVLTALRLDRYDPLGNLRAPSGDTVYSAGQ
jgi:hypothetical protein